MYSRVVFWRRICLGESEEKAMAQPKNKTLELYVRCWYETDRWHRVSAWLKLKRAYQKELDKLVDYGIKIYGRVVSILRYMVDFRNH